MANLAASIVLEARKHPDGLGTLDEGRLLQGAYGLPESEQLSASIRQLLLQTIIRKCIVHHVCYRQAINKDVYLVFPELMAEGPHTDGPHRFVDTMHYYVTGTLDRTYSSLVVLLVIRIHLHDTTTGVIVLNMN